MAKVALRLEQKMKVSQIQRLTIQMMALHGQELQTFLHEQVTENPLLDIRYPDIRPAGSGGEKPIDNLRGCGDSLEEMLMKELRVQSVPKPVLLAAGLVIQNLDDKGFFCGDLAELGSEYRLDERTMDAGLRLVQTFDPPGVGARSIQETLLIQTRRSVCVPEGTEAVLLSHYDDFLHGRWQRLERAVPISARQLQAIRRFLKTLSLQPAVQTDERHTYVRADMEIYCNEQGTLSVRSLEELPEVFFRDDLYSLYRKEKAQQVQQFIRRSKQRFLDLKTALAYRWQSIAAVMDCILAVQQQYFLSGQPLRPLTQKNIAAATALSEATVSRVCRDRYALFAGRIYGIQEFLAHQYACDTDGHTISDQEIKKDIARIIAEEDWRHPVSDQQLATYFAKRHIQIARRTVTKFRLQLRIPNSSMRKRIQKT